jgi:hypothetical protein
VVVAHIRPSQDAACSTLIVREMSAKDSVRKELPNPLSTTCSFSTVPFVSSHGTTVSLSQLKEDDEYARCARMPEQRSRQKAYRKHVNFPYVATIGYMPGICSGR